MAKKASPTEVTLRFATPYAKGYFLGQLSDGWGENYVFLKWDGRRHMTDCPVIDVGVWAVEDDGTVITDEESDPSYQRMKKCYEKHGLNPDGTQPESEGASG